ncbi:hypothetical protein LOAG_05851 [Loa loa]|uniref:Uncharacterized protein n=1 Tax=Loa loa TaxID=7209 RepID=A0A1S0U0Q4_LOALO|nr:hypothetical protein LOAG_05851 [Loa loa]EFO22635.1 hypothetical protein LOAG_05851 [Loa loa]
MQKNSNYSAREKKINDDEEEENMSVSNADYFDAIIHAIIPGPLDIPALYRTYAILPSIDNTSKNDTSLSSTTINYSSIFINKNTNTNNNNNNNTNTNTNDITITTTTSTVRIVEITEIPSVNVKYTTINCTRYSGIHWNTTTTTTAINCNSDNGKQFSYLSLPFHFIN